MQRRTLSSSLLLLPLTLVVLRAQAQGLAGITDADASKGLKAALENGAIAAVRLLGVQDGFLANPKVRIPLPKSLQDASKLLKALGQGKQVDELGVAMNRAAENAVPLAKNLLVSAARNLSVADAKAILTGGDTSVTNFFADKTRAPLSGQFLPVVKQQTAKVGLAARYDALAGKAAGAGLMKQEDASIDHYVTRKALDGLYLVIGEEEKKLRSNPVAAGSDILRKVFGALK